MIITHRITEDGRHALEFRIPDEPKKCVAVVVGPYDQPLFVVVQGEPFMALSGHFAERAGIYKLDRMVPRRIEAENRRVVECDSAKQEYDYGS